MSGFDEVLRSAFMAGVHAGAILTGEVIDGYEAEPYFKKWRQELGDAKTRGVGASGTMGHKQAEDEGGAETVSRSSTTLCTCPTPGITHTENYHKALDNAGRQISEEILKRVRRQ